ncbi:MAG: PKD domain-containing protein, partial [Flavobacteriales bacterium]|nr:PKD domain-containing protein [Flavobacteriales bacterium]
NDNGGTDRGAAYLLFLNPNGSVKKYFKISSTTTDFVGHLDNNDWFGIDVSGIGDFDNNGVMDIMVSAGLDDDGGADRGAFYIIHLENICPTISSSCNRDSVTTFQKVYGGTGNERAHSIQQTIDGGYIVAGETTSFGAGNKDWFVMKINANGIEQWSKTYGSSASDDGNSITIKQTSDLGYILAGHTEGFGAGSFYDSYIIKLDNLGNIQWEKRISGSSYDSFRDVIELSNGDFLLTGSGLSFASGNMDAHMVKISSAGNLVWIKNLGTNGREHSQTIIELPNGDYLLGGNTNVSNNSQTNAANAFLIKTTNNGTVIWGKEYNSGMFFSDINETILLNDGNYLSIGETRNSDTGNHDMRILKTDTNGVVIWSKNYGGTGEDIPVNVREKGNGDLVISGYTASFGGANQLFLMSTDSLGNVIWTKTYGGTSNDETEWWGKTMELSTTNEIIMAGGTRSFGAGNEDVYIIKTNECGESLCNEEDIILTSSSPIISDVNFTVLTTTGGSLVNTNSILNTINFTDNFLCSDTLVTLEKSCNALNFDGLNDYVELNSLATPMAGKTTYTIEFWMKADKDDQSSSIRSSMFAINPNTSNGNGLLIILGGDFTNEGKLMIYDENTFGTAAEIKSTQVIGDNLCHHIAYSRNGNTSSAYIDGVLVGQHSTSYTITSSDLFSIGQEWDNLTTTPLSSQFYNGEIDDLRIWGEARTIVQIQSNMNNELTGNEPNLIAYYNFNQGVAGSNNLGINTLMDSSPNNISGTLNGFSLNGNIYNWILDNCTNCSSSNHCNLSSNFNSINRCLNDTTYFTDLSIDSLDNIIDWQWNFGDGTTLTGIQNPSHLYTNSGNFNVTLIVINDNNCSDSITIPLTIHSNTTSTQNLSICQGDSVFFDGQFYNTTGIYSDSLQSSFGCDSIHTLNLNVINSFIISQDQSICQGDSILLGGNYQFLAGIYTDSLQSTSGCDSIVNTTLTINPLETTNQNLAICQGDSIFLEGVFQTSAGLYTDIYNSMFGCD